MKKGLWILLCMLLPMTLFAQQTALKAVDAAKQKEMVATINQAASSMKSIVCDFEQTKSLSLLNDKFVSKGKMYYKQGQRLRWEYLSPYKYIFIVNGSKIILKANQQQKNELDVRSSKMFQEVVQIMMNSVTGKCLNDGTSFKVTLYTTTNQRWVARLVPLKKEIKQMFSLITLYFDQNHTMVSAIDLQEKNGDVTHIELKNVELNKGVNEKIFTLD